MVIGSNIVSVCRSSIKVLLVRRFILRYICRSDSFRASEEMTNLF